MLYYISIELVGSVLCLCNSDLKEGNIEKWRAKNNDSEGCSEEEKPKDAIGSNKLKNKELHERLRRRRENNRNRHQLENDEQP